MTTTTTEQLDDLADLALLDDPHRHIMCTRCWPNHPPGKPYTAYCGKQAIPFSFTRIRPPNVCPQCQALAHQPCPKGHQ